MSLSQLQFTSCIILYIPITYLTGSVPLLWPYPTTCEETKLAASSIKHLPEVKCVLRNQHYNNNACKMFSYETPTNQLGQSLSRSQRMFLCYLLFLVICILSDVWKFLNTQPRFSLIVFSPTPRSLILNLRLLSIHLKIPFWYTPLTSCLVNMGPIMDVRLPSSISHLYKWPVGDPVVFDSPAKGNSSH